MSGGVQSGAREAIIAASCLLQLMPPFHLDERVFFGSPAHPTLLVDHTGFRHGKEFKGFRSTTGAEATPFTAESDQFFVVTGLAPDP